MSGSLRQAASLCTSLPVTRAQNPHGSLCSLSVGPGAGVSVHLCPEGRPSSGLSLPAPALLPLPAPRGLSPNTACSHFSELQAGSAEDSGARGSQRSGVVTGPRSASSRICSQVSGKPTSAFGGWVRGELALWKLRSESLSLCMCMHTF